jgi:hypothetical protein
LRALPAPQPEQPDRVQEAMQVLRPQWPELRAAWLAEEWGIKSKLVRLVWGDDHRWEGSFAEWIEAAVAKLESEGAGAENATATATATNTSAPVENAVNGYAHPGSSSNRNRKAQTLRLIQRLQEDGNV